MILDSEMHVSLESFMGDDLSIVRAARISTGAETVELDGAAQGLVRFLMKNRHASPFEHVTATFRIEAPLFVAREWMRHRTQSFNEESGRYTELKPRFYMPAQDRPLKQMGKPGAYDMRPGCKEQQDVTEGELGFVYRESWKAYRRMIEAGVAREVARMALPVGIYTSFYATANLRNWLNFLSLRTEDQAMFEIRQAAYQIEVLLEYVAPYALSCWQEYGRGSL